MKGLVCSLCGYVALDGVAPDNCPVCHAPKKMFNEKENAIVEPSEATEKQESNKKHIPKMVVVKKCGLIPDGCIDVHVKVGEITHPMQPDHFIRAIDCYIDKKYILRALLTPENLNPAVGLHLKATQGTFTAIEHCTLHGSWAAEVEL